MEWVRVTALAAAPKPERSFMLLDFFFFFFFFFLIYHWIAVFCAVIRRRVVFFFFFSFLLLFFVPLTRSADSRQCLPTYLAEWQWLSALLFSPHSHFPVCWWIPTPRHCAGGMPETALQSTVLMLQLGWLGNTADVFVEVVFQHRTHLMLLIFTACWLIYTRYAGLIDSQSVDKSKYEATFRDKI